MSGDRAVEEDSNSLDDETRSSDAIDISLPTSSMSKLAELQTRKEDIDTIRQQIVDGTSDSDSSNHNQCIMLAKISQLECSINNSIDGILQEWNVMKTGLEEKILSLQSDVDASNKKATDLADALRSEKRISANCKAREKKMLEQKATLEATIELLVEDYRAATERIVDIEESKDSDLEKKLIAANEEISCLTKERDQLLEEVDDHVSIGLNKDTRDQEKLVAKQQHQIASLIERERMLQEMNDLLETQQHVAIDLAKKELESENELLLEEIDVCRRRVDELQSEQRDRGFDEKSLRQEVKLLKKRVSDLLKGRMQSGFTEEDLSWKVKALTNELSVLKDQIRCLDAEKTADQLKLNALPKLESTIEEQQIELEQNDVMISNLRSEEVQYKKEIIRLETWLHESLSFASQPPPATKGNPQSPGRTPKRYGKAAPHLHSPTSPRGMLEP